MPIQDAPQKLIEAWLRFHKTELCQKIDAVFVYNRVGVEIWCVVTSDKNYRKLRQLFEPLERLYRIELYPTRPPVKKKSENDIYPPPSLSENQELRANLGDPSIHLKDPLEDNLMMDEIFPPNEILKQRLVAFANQTLEWNRNIKRYAQDLPELISIALDPVGAPGLRAHAQAVCIEHAKNLNKTLRKLRKNMVFAHPKDVEGIPSAPGMEKAETAEGDLPERAERIFAAAQSLGRNVYRFIYPEQHTVDLDELRQSSLIESLRKLEGMVRDFQEKLDSGR
jgi:hypothetical protein